MATKIVEGFSVTHAAILNGTTGVQEEFGDIYGINDGSIELDTDSYDNEGDDTILSTWFWLNYATVTVQAGYIPFDTLGLLYGVTVTSSGTAPNDTYSIPLWNEKAQNQAVRPMLVRTLSKDSAGIPRTLDFILFRVQFMPFSFDGPSYRDGLKLNYEGRALLSSVDEAGNALTERAIGRLVSRPPV